MNNLAQGEVIVELKLDSSNFQSELLASQELIVGALGNIEASLSDIGKKSSDVDAGTLALQQLGGQLQQTGQTISSITTDPLVSLAKNSVEAAKTYEDALTGVIKTTNPTIEQIEMLSDGFRDLAKEIPLSAAQLADIGAIAGQLGVDVDNILDFTEVIAKLDTATNLTAESAGVLLAQFANITNLDYSDFDRLGATIVALGNNLATQESDIVELGQRLAAAGSQAGFAEYEILAFAGALSSVGLEAQAGGTALSKIITQMQVAAETGLEAQEVVRRAGEVIGITNAEVRDLRLYLSQAPSGDGSKWLAENLNITTQELTAFLSKAEDLENFAEVSGRTSEQFSKDFGENAAQVLQDFIIGLDQTTTSGKTAVQVLDELGVTEVRLRDSLLRASGAADLFNDALALGAEAWDENIALEEEAELRYKTFSSQLQLLTNLIEDAFISLGDPLISILQALITFITPLIEFLGKLAEGFSNLPKPIQVIIVVFLSAIAAIGPLVTAIGSLIQIIVSLSLAGKLLPVLGGLFTGFGTSASTGLKIAGTGLAQFAATASSAIPIILTITAAVLALAALFASLGYLSGNLSNLGNSINKEINSINNSVSNAAKSGMSGKAFASGTNNAPQGWAKINENGPEAIITPSGRMFAYFNGGEQVLTASKTADLIRSGDFINPTQSMRNRGNYEAMGTQQNVYVNHMERINVSRVDDLYRLLESFDNQQLRERMK